MHDAPVHAFNRQILVRRAIRTPPRTCASARACLNKSALSLLRGAISMHRMRAHIPRIALSLLRGAIFMHRMRAGMPRIAFSFALCNFFARFVPERTFFWKVRIQKWIWIVDVAQR